jgi:hypothetical protein
MEVELLVTWIDKYKKEQNPIALSDPIKQSGKQWREKDLRIKTWFQPLAIKQLSVLC